jgi:hypothetical protein
LYHGLIHIPRGPNVNYPKSPTVTEMDMVRIQDVLKKDQKLKYQDIKDDSYSGPLRQDTNALSLRE